MTTKTIVSAGQSSTGGTISSQQEQDVYGQTTDTTVLSQGLQVIESGGASEGTYLDGVFSKPGIQDVEKGGVADKTEITGNGIQYVFTGGEATNTLVDPTGVQYDFGTTTDTLLDQSIQFVTSGGSAIGTDVEGGGRQYVAAGSSSTDTSLTSLNGQSSQVVEAGGSAIGTNIGDNAVLFLDDMTSSATGTVIENGGSISLGYVAYAADGSAHLDPTTDLLTIVDGGTTVTEQLSGSYAGEQFVLSSDNGNLEVTASDTPCYCRGTLIETNRGQVRVEELQIGDIVKVKSGELRPIKWIGTRSFSGRFIASNRDILPICVKAGALEDRVPSRDLWISPHHAMYLDGLLIEAKDLVNGFSIVQATSVERVEYFHIELDSHDVIVAEGALSETFIDDDSRAMFHNAKEYAALYSDQSITETVYCAPRVVEGEALEAVRIEIEARAYQATFEELVSIAG